MALPKAILTKSAPFLVLSAVLGLSACKNPFSKDSAPPTASVAGTEVRVLTWSEYFKDEAIANFEKKSGVKVVRDYFANNEELLAKIKASIDSGSRGYDLILPSDYMVATMARLKLLKPIDHAALDVLSQFGKEFLKPSYDPELKYCVPFAYGTTGIAVNTKLAPKLDLSKGISWKDLLESKEYAGKVTMLDDAKENFHAALLALGKSWDAATEADIRAAFEYLKANKKKLKLYASEARPVLENDECALCQVFSGDALSVGLEKPEIKYFIPREGATLWTDNLAWPVNGQNERGAYEFVRYLLNAENAKTFTIATRYPTPNLEARKLLPPQLAQDPMVYPSEEQFKKLAFLREKEELLPLIDRLWTELKSL